MADDRGPRDKADGDDAGVLSSLPSTRPSRLSRRAAATPSATDAESAAAQAKPAGAPKRGGELRIVQINDFVSMDPIHASGPTARGVYDSLFAWRPNAQGVYGVEPMLAKSWELGTDKLVIKLQENVTFHDGSSFEAKDVLVSLSAQWDNLSVLHKGATGAFSYWPGLWGGFLNPPAPCGIADQPACTP
jgi:ABC-type transport system substrate-binding protein